ncbi:unnamed protein product [Bursaphelenchus okinawaensis]|uniref:Uncharacterized protein n=1 Tax=Bursaphelenchus okinawaensis TaxID=465554 RepID=A0A811JRB6_9BILA|nr:unnamed protein product [Bursaphelenchus okinawaensis]CAG9079670.1 unnamed protein product [Bursaphelenchus okinawaensis]
MARPLDESLLRLFKSFVNRKDAESSDDEFLNSKISRPEKLNIFDSENSMRSTNNNTIPLKLDTSHVEEFYSLADSLHEEFEQINVSREAPSKVKGSVEELMQKVQLQEAAEGYVHNTIDRVLVVIRKKIKHTTDQYEITETLCTELESLYGLNRLDVDHTGLCLKNDKYTIAFLVLLESEFADDVIRRFQMNNVNNHDYVLLCRGDRFVMSSLKGLKIASKTLLNKVLDELIDRT